MLFVHESLKLLSNTISAAADHNKEASNLLNHWKEELGAVLGISKWLVLGSESAAACKGTRGRASLGEYDAVSQI